MSRATRTKSRETATLFGDVQAPEKKPAESKTTPEKSARNTKAKSTAVAVSNVEKIPSARPENLIASLLNSITDPRIEPAKVHALLDARDRMMREQAHVEFMSAYIAMQGELPSISRDGKIDQGTTKSGREGVKARWATFENINAVVRPLLVKHKMGLLLLPDTGADGTGIVVRGQLGYVCETDYGKIVHVERCTIPVPNDSTGGKSPPQGVGSALSYGKRYGAIALLNIVSHAPDDADDLDKRRAPKEEPKLSDEELKKLKAAITFCESTEEEFCKFYKLKSLDMLPPDRFAEAMDACRRRAEGNAAEKKGG